MTTWVLILFFTTFKGTASVTVEFSDQSSCHQAAAQMISKKPLYYTVEYVCVPKGTK